MSSLFDLFNESKTHNFNYTLRNLICDWKHTIWSLPASLSYEKWWEETNMTKSKCGSAAFNLIHSCFGFGVQCCAALTVVQRCRLVNMWWKWSLNLNWCQMSYTWLQIQPQSADKLWISENEEQISKTVMSVEIRSVRTVRDPVSHSPSLIIPAKIETISIGC